MPLYPKSLGEDAEESGTSIEQGSKQREKVVQNMSETCTDKVCTTSGAIAERHMSKPWKGLGQALLKANSREAQNKYRTRNNTGQDENIHWKMSENNSDEKYRNPVDP